MNGLKYHMVNDLSVRWQKFKILNITIGNMKRLPCKTFHNIDAVSGNYFILLVIAS